MHRFLHKKAISEVSMGLISLKLKLVFILLILKSFASENSANISCFWKYFGIKCDEDINFKDLLYKALFGEDEVERPLISDNSIKTDEKSKADKSVESDESAIAQKQISVEETPSNIFHKSDVNSEFQNHIIQNVEIGDKSQLEIQRIHLEEEIQKPTCITSSVFDFKFQANVNFKEHNVPISPSVYLKFCFPVLGVFLLLITVFFYRKIDNLGRTVEILSEKMEDIRDSVINMFTCQDEVQSINVDDFEEQLDNKNKVLVFQKNGSEWTAEEVLCYLKRLAENAVTEFPSDENVKYLSDAFLTEVANIIIDRNLFEDLKYLTPLVLLQNARDCHRSSKIHEHRKKERKVDVIVNVDGVQRKVLGSSSSIE